MASHPRTERKAGAVIAAELSKRLGIEVVFTPEPKPKAGKGGAGA